MAEEHRVTEGHEPRAVTGGGAPQQAWRSHSLTDQKSWQPPTDSARPTVGPDTPSGVSSANAANNSSNSPTSSVSADGK